MRNLPEPCVVVLVGPGASGKSTWAAAHFPADRVVSSDRLRALVGEGEDDIAASADAFALLETVIEHRLKRRLTTVIDTLGLDAERRRAWLVAARAKGMPCVAVAFDTPAAQCRERNRQRAKRIPADALNQHLRAWARTRDALAAEGFDAVLAPEPVRLVPDAFAGSTALAGGAATTVPAASDRPHAKGEQSGGLRFGLHLSEFKQRDVRQVARDAEATGFDAVYVMDHFRQIPQLGRAWDDFLESYTTLAYLAACTDRVRLGALVTGVTYRNVAHLGKIIATLDVLSGGRAVCGLGLAWFKEEHLAYGWPFPPVEQRYALLEDALRLLPLLWGKGSPRFEGKVLSVPEALCYPRPVQRHVPVIVGGGGERRTLRLAARYADAANVLGDLATVRRKAEVLRRHAAEAGREVELTHLTTALIGADDRHVAALLDRRPPRVGAARYAAQVNAGTVEDHIGRCRALAEAGVREVMLRLPDPECMEPAAKLIAAFR